ncbi:hypothetical protein C8R45DRAFT_840301 [Mycena sanguinolenta]|nr:hypothetical protein C8R45DRAFT_840301 [Mycena sanguinolenta]
MHSYKYPVLNLPTEIITEIFLCIPSPYPSCSQLVGTVSPTSLTQICREWRQIALSITSLWRAINLSNNGTPVEQRAWVHNLWPKWSRSSPLSTEFNAGVDQADARSKVMALVASNLARLEHLKLAVSLDDLRTIRGSMPLLHHLDLDLPQHSGIEPVSFSELPLLRSVVLNSVASQSVRLPWAQLTSLALHRIGIDECIPILPRTSNLIHCKHLVYPYLNFGRTVKVSRLESLVLTGDDQPRTNYLRFFITRSLHRLTIPERFMGNKPSRSLTDFISKSGATLQEVRITDKRSVPENSYRNALQSVPRLFFSQREPDNRVELEIESDSNS